VKIRGSVQLVLSAVPAAARRIKAYSLCNFQVATAWLHGQTDAGTEAGQHVNKRIRAEQVDPTAKRKLNF